MDIEYIIIQAGGLGTRMGDLTRNRPKSLVPVKNLPIIFHMFEKFPDKKFIVIGDYKFNVLERYLRTFAKVDYLLIRAGKKGNVAGVRDALRLVPKGIPLMLVWSDIILSEQYRLPEENRECYVGISENFPCSWKLENGKLKKITSEKYGVAGCFLFDKKERLDMLPEEGSFASWLSQSGLTFSTMDMWGSIEVGTSDAVSRIDTTENRCRPYNHMEFQDEKVVKTGLTEEGRKLIDREARWYEKVSRYGFTGIPRIYSYEPLTMGRIHGDNIFKASLDDDQKRRTIDRLVDALEILHRYEEASPDYFGLQEDYYTKTIKRIQGIRDVIPLTGNPYITINGAECKNIFFFEEELERDIRETLFDAQFGPIHGDCTLTNTMIDQEGEIYYIDARGYFGKRELFGDIYYDWAKLYYSIYGCFDQFNVKNFDLEIRDNEIRYTIGASGWEHLTDYFLSRIPDCNISKIKLIHAIIWMSLASHCWEDYDSLCLAFYNGIYLWNEWMKEYRIESGKK